MNPTFSFPALEQMSTPVMICNARGTVIFKNSAAVAQVRLPRRNTSVRSHLRQVETDELARIPERRKPSILTLHNGDRPMRALVMPYVKDRECGPALATADAAADEVCSLWIFPAVLQVFSTSLTAQYVEMVMEDLSADLCQLVKQADRISGLLPGTERKQAQQKLDRRVMRMLNMLTTLPDGRWFDLRHAMEILLPLLSRRLELVGAEVIYTEDEDLFTAGQAIDLSRMSILLLHLLSYCIPLSDSRTVHLHLRDTGGGLRLTASFTLHWPPFTEEYSEDIRKLCLLLPSGQLELLVLNSLAKGFGTPLRYSLTDEAEDNLTLYLPLPLSRRTSVRTMVLSSTEQIFLERDLEALFAAVLETSLALPEEPLE